MPLAPLSFSFSVHAPIMSPPVARETHTLRLHLLRFSTGTPHPRAARPVLVLGRTAPGYHSVMIEAVGRALVLLILYPPNGARLQDEVRVYDWMSGDLLLVSLPARRPPQSETPHRY
jgi:hypothetical protein